MLKLHGTFFITIAGANDQDAPTNDEERWTFVTYKKMRKPSPQAIRPTWGKGENTAVATIGSPKETQELLRQRMLGNLLSKSYAFLSPCTSTSRMTSSNSALLSPDTWLK
ncbi:hypothetical protein ACFXTN_017552 [Malus domestica]